MRWILSALMGVVFAGCWNKDYNEPGQVEIEKKPTEAILNGSFQRTWASTQAIMAKFPIVKKDADPGTGRAYLVTDWIRGKSDRLFHGFDVNRIPYMIRYKLFIYLTSDSQMTRTKIAIKNQEQYLDDTITAGVDFEGGLQSWIKTESSTLKENSVIEQIDKLIRDPKFRGETSPSQ